MERWEVQLERKKMMVRKLEKAEKDLEVAVDLDQQAKVEALVGKVVRLKEYLAAEEEEGEGEEED